MTEPADIFIDEEKALKWLRRGAQPSDTAKRLLTKNGILLKFEYERLGKTPPEEQDAETDAETTDAETTDEPETVTTPADDAENGTPATDTTE